MSKLIGLECLRRFLLLWYLVARFFAWSAWLFLLHPLLHPRQLFFAVLG
jgi:hypothetical protein